ncbi:MAG: murein hydrolase activator EnvC [Pseudobdellovibrionaceae bacterium]
MVRPVQGNIASGFGPKADTLQNDGINIVAVRGAPVRAAENGVVIYAGEDLASYGKLILVKHEGGLVTAYAHQDKFLVTKGQVVNRGQTIGTVGSSGNVQTPQLHFEVRKGSKPVNPTTYLE